jgi:hypothetical protein
MIATCIFKYSWKFDQLYEKNIIFIKCKVLCPVWIVRIIVIVIIIIIHILFYGTVIANQGKVIIVVLILSNFYNDW